MARRFPSSSWSDRHASYDFTNCWRPAPIRQQLFQYPSGVVGQCLPTATLFPPHRGEPCVRAHVHTPPNAFDCIVPIGNGNAAIGSCPKFVNFSRNFSVERLAYSFDVPRL